MPEQIPLFQPFHEVSFDSYCAGNNAEVIAQIKSQILVPDQPCVYLWGKAGVGKSHVLQAACSFAYQQHKHAAYVPLIDYGAIQPDILQGLESYAVICIDDIDAVAGQNAWEQALFHLFNLARDHGALLMFAATKKPTDLDIELRDLVSRLAWGTVWHLEELPDRDKLSALQVRARQRGFSISDEVGTYLMQRLPRDMHSLFALLDKLDHASLSEHRKLTIPFVRQFIE
ncbi:DnaA regulatory inactivator Hda [Kaarinaea lacus]